MSSPYGHTSDVPAAAPLEEPARGGGSSVVEYQCVPRGIVKLVEFLGKALLAHKDLGSYIAGFGRLSQTFDYLYFDHYCSFGALSAVLLPSVSKSLLRFLSSF